jgi:hypothetical protein
MKIRPRIRAEVIGTNMECLNACIKYCLLTIEDPIAYLLCVAGCWAVCTN